MSRSLGSRRISPIFVENDNEKLRCMVGNSAIVFEVMFEGRKMALRVYMRKHPNLQAIYGDRYYPKELLVHSSHTDYTLADVVLCDWYEGESLQRKIEQCYDKPSKMRALSKMFEEFAISLLNERWAHGDIKPENIILSSDGLHLIDFDAMYREGFTSDDCVEIGTQQFQHPSRDKSTFSRDIDDYPIALITTALAAMALDSSIGRNIPEMDHLLIRPELAVKGEDVVGVVLSGHDGRRGFIHHMAVTEEYRYQGIASNLLDHALSALEAEGINKVALLVFNHNDARNAFWEKQGFTVRDDVTYRNRVLTEMVRIDT
jgi:ribosomal protein S18 acetylase RimI-like enzyme